MENNRDEVEAAAHDGRREAYESPAVAWEEQVEIRANLAIACNKQTGMSDPCNQANTS